MDKSQIAEIIRKRLNLEDQDWSMIEKNPKFQKLFQNAIEASKYRLIAEVIESKGFGSSSRRARASTRRHTQIFRGVEARDQNRNWAKKLF